MNTPIKQTWFLLVATLVLLSACTTEEATEVLDQPSEAYSQNGSAAPGTPHPQEVGFTEVEIPDIYHATADEYVSETRDVILVTASGDSIQGKVRVTFPVGIEGKISSLEFSTDLLESTGLTPSFWVDGFDGDDSTAELNIGECLAACGGFWCKAGCWVLAAAEVAAVVAAFVRE